MSTPLGRQPRHRRVPGFTINRHELLVLAGLYLNDTQDVEYFLTATAECSSPSMSRLAASGWKRLAVIENALGKEDMRTGLKAVEQEWKAAFLRITEPPNGAFRSPGFPICNTKLGHSYATITPRQRD